MVDGVTLISNNDYKELILKLYFFFSFSYFDYI